MNQIIDQACLVQINITIFYDFFEVLYSYRIFHIAAVLNSFGKVTKNNDTSKGIARKKITRLQNTIFVGLLTRKKNNTFAF